MHQRTAFEGETLQGREGDWEDLAISYTWCSRGHSGSPMWVGLWAEPYSDTPPHRSLPHSPPGGVSEVLTPTRPHTLFESEDGSNNLINMFFPLFVIRWNKKVEGFI